MRAPGCVRSLGKLGTLGLCSLGSLGAGSLVWAMCAVFVTRDPTQIVAAVGSLAISGVTGVALFVVRVSTGGGESVHPTVPAISPTVVFVAARETGDLQASVAIDGGFVHAHLAVSASPPKLAVFVFCSDE
jgi:hypothetical protein